MPKQELLNEAVDEIQQINLLTKELFKNACAIIDGQMQHGYAQKNPALVSSIVNNQVDLILQLTPRAPSQKQS